MWSLMMAAMMLPTVHRTTRLYVTAVRQQSRSQAWMARLALLLGGYLLVWSAIGIPVYLLEVLVQRLVAAGAIPAAIVTALLIAAAGLFQFSTLKERCLHHCQSPLAFVSHYMTRTGWARDVLAGLAHGWTCLGCCAAMVLVFIAVGTMSVPAMVVLGAIAMVEKTWVYGVRFSRIAGAGMIAFALAVLVHAASVPAVHDLHQHHDIPTQSDQPHH